jgi:hypothetical protein
VSLEARGLPTAVVITEAFVHEADVQRAALGMEGLRPVVIQHPLSTLTEEEIALRIQQTIEQAPQIWLYGSRANV